MSFIYCTSSFRSSSCKSVEVYAPSLDNPRVEKVVSSPLLEEASPVNLKVFLGLEFIRSSLDYDSIVSVSLLDCLQTIYCILAKFDL